MNKKELVLMGLYPHPEKCLSPVQVQKLYFLLDRNLPKALGNPVFNFQPYNYGPFDKEVYETLRDLASLNLVAIDNNGRWPLYQISEKGKSFIEPKFEVLSQNVQQYIFNVVDFITGVSFSELVTAIYKAYPEMRENSVFQD